jgi:hypothetical protein
LIYFNARSLRNKINELKILITEYNPDIIGVVETWLKDDIQDSEIMIDGYSFIRIDRRNDQKVKGGGVLVYIKDELSFINITEKYCPNIDHIWVKVYDKSFSTVIVGVFYRPPDCSEDQLRFLLDVFSRYKTANTIVVGDFNYGDINWKKYTSGATGKKFLKEVSNLAMYQCVKNETRGKNILDLVLVYEKDFLNGIKQLAPVGKSDHNTLVVTLNVKVHSSNKMITIYKYDKANYRDLENRINRIDWEGSVDSKTAEEIWTDLKTILNNFRDHNIPKTIKNVDKGLPWYNGKIKRLIKKRNNLYKRFKKTGLYYFRLKYNVARNLVTKQIRIVKAKYEANMIKKSKNNRKIFYSYIATKNRKTCSKKIGPLVKLGVDGKQKDMIVEDKEIASLLNDYFISVFNKQDDTNVKTDISESSSQDVILENIKIIENDIVDAIGEFKVNKSPGADGISSTYALKIKEIVAKPLACLFRRSIVNNEIPLDWKNANITPIFKKGDRSNVENYRPISLTPLFGKVFEKIIKRQIEDYLRCNALINTSQHGFSKARSCLSNLLVCQDSIMNMLDEGLAVDIVYLDFQKAFDKVPHSRLMEKVRHLGIKGKVADWIANWLSNRKQRVVINGMHSDWGDVKSGVPQGSILGPLLFTIFINDLDNKLVNNIIKFADDTKIWGQANTLDGVRTIQQDLVRLNEWSELNCMPFNVSKCKVLHIGSKNLRAEYMLSGKQITETKEEKDLGVFFSESYKPSLNCKRASKTANMATGLIRRNVFNKSEEGMMTLYKTLVRPSLDYCIQVWKPFLKKDIVQLEKIQKRYTKMITGYKALTYEQRLEKLGLTTIEERHHRADMIQVYKVLNDKLNVFPKDFLILNQRPGRKNSLKLFKRRNSLEVSRQCFASRVVERWNSLPDEVVLSKDVNVFKGRLDYHMRNVRGQI